MAVTITPLLPHLGARVEGVDLARGLDDATFRAIAAAFEDRSVLVFHDQHLTDEQQMRFSERFGPLEATLASIGQERRLHPNLVDLSNIDPDHDEKLMDWSDRRMIYQSGNQLWHTDSSFKPVPAMASLLSGREVPPVGGETEFVSMRHAHATLPDETRRRIEGRVVVHSILYSRSTIAKGLFDPEHERGLPPVRQALVRANPVHGRKSIYIGSHAAAPDRRPARSHHAPGRGIPAPLEAMGSRDVGQPLRAAPRPSVGCVEARASDASHDRGGRGPHRGSAVRDAHALVGRHHPRGRRSVES